MAKKSLPQKIVLRNETGMSLNDRFSQLHSKAAVHIQVSRQRLANAKKQRFARQMANRQLVVPANIKNQQVNLQMMVDDTSVQQRQSALMRIGYRGTGRGGYPTEPWRGARRGQQFISRGWRGRGGAPSYNTVTATPQFTYFRGRGMQRGRWNRGFMGASRGGYYGVQRRGWGRVRGRSSWSRGGAGGQSTTRAQLDTELDSYMTSTN